MTKIHLFVITEEPSGSMSLSVSMTQTSITEQATGATIEDEHIPPEFFEEPCSTTVEEGGCAKFVCDVDGEPIPNGKLIYKNSVQRKVAKPVMLISYSCSFVALSLCKNMFLASWGSSSVIISFEWSVNAAAPLAC